MFSPSSSSDALAVRAGFYVRVGRARFGGSMRAYAYVYVTYTSLHARQHTLPTTQICCDNHNICRWGRRRATRQQRNLHRALALEKFCSKRRKNRLITAVPKGILILIASRKTLCHIELTGRIDDARRNVCCAKGQ